jgi:hypothetical protein
MQLSRALNLQVHLMIKFKYIFSFLSFYLSFSYASSSRSLPSYIDRASQKLVVRKHTQFLVALDRVQNGACTNRITNSPVWGIFFTSWATVNVSRECSTELFVTGWTDLLQSVLFRKTPWDICNYLCVCRPVRHTYCKLQDTKPVKSLPGIV